MSSRGSVTLQIAGGLALAALGAWLLAWSGAQIAHSRAALAWPVAEGVVISSSLDDDGGEPVPAVVYTYAVGGETYAADQLGFDVFDQPGGRGRTATLVARYPVGARVVVHHAPDDPAEAVLEPGDVSPFVTPLGLGALIVALGAGLAAQAVRAALAGGTPAEDPRAAHRRAAVLVTILFLFALLAASADSAVQEVFAAAGAPAGLPPVPFWIGLQIVLFLPVPWFVWHVMIVVQAAGAEGRAVRGALGLAAAVWEARDRPDLGPSARATLAAFGYYLLIVGSWISFTAVRGL